MVGSQGNAVPVTRTREHLSTVRFAEVGTQLQGTVVSDDASGVADICNLEKDARKGSLA